MPDLPEHTTQTAAICAERARWRSELRRAALARRMALDDAEYLRLGTAITTHLLDLLSQRAPGVLGFCWPVRREFDTRPLLAQLAPLGWRACMPVVVAENAPMAFHAWTPEMPMSADRYGIPIPIEAQLLAPDVLLVPLVAFDAAGYRLGYGGGYFDRTLAQLDPAPLTVGVGYELNRVDSIRPESHDIPLDRIVTEAASFEPTSGKPHP